jgi:replicative DNA helicase
MAAPEYPQALVNVEAEAALLGGMMIDNGIVDQIAEMVTSDDFAEPLHGDIFNVIVSEVAAGHRATPPLLRVHFTDHHAGGDIAIPEYLSGLTGSGAALIGARDFARQVGDLAKRRRLLDEMRALQGDLAVMTEAPVEELVDKIDGAMAAALNRAQTTRSMTVAKAFDHTLQKIEDEAAGKGPQGIRIDGLPDFNELTGDLRRGEVLILAGRPSMGKTATALGVTLGAARAGFGTLFISLEMRVEELLARAITDLIFTYGNSPSFDQVRKGRFSGFDRDKLAEARAKIADWPLVITDPATLSIGRLAMMVRRYQRQMAAKGQTLDLVVIDYLGLIRGTDRKAKRYEEVGEISRILKQVAKECDVALIVLAQLNRECERRDDKRPMLSDLRDAGDIEQDADVVMFVYREQYYLERSEPDAHDKKRAQWEVAMGAAKDRLELIVAKARQGRVAKRLCFFFGAHQAVRGSYYMRDLNQ